MAMGYPHDLARSALRLSAAAKTCLRRRGCSASRSNASRRRSQSVNRATSAPRMASASGVVGPFAPSRMIFALTRGAQPDYQSVTRQCLTA